MIWMTNVVSITRPSAPSQGACFVVSRPRIAMIASGTQIAGVSAWQSAIPSRHRCAPAPAA